MNRPTREARELVGAVACLALAHLHGDALSPMPRIVWTDGHPDYAGQATKIEDGWRIELSKELEGVQLAEVLAHELRHTVQRAADPIEEREADATAYESRFGRAFFEVAAILDTDPHARVVFEKWGAKSTPAPGDVCITETGEVRRWQAERRTTRPVGFIIKPPAPLRAIAPYAR